MPDDIFNSMATKDFYLLGILITERFLSKAGHQTSLQSLEDALPCLQGISKELSKINVIMKMLISMAMQWCNLCYMLWCNRLWSCGWVPAGGARCRGQRPAASGWWSGSLSWCRGVEQIRLWSILFFSLMYTYVILNHGHCKNIYVNDGRVQLFKSTSKLGDNHQRRETMTLAGEMNWLCRTMTMTKAKTKTKTRNLTGLN